MKVFYESLIEYSRVDRLISGLNEAEKNEILSLIKETLTLRLIDSILDKLSPASEELFWELFLEDASSEDILTFLEGEVAGARLLITEKAKGILDELESEILEEEKA